jgi:DNA-directed RNA polymerase subunit D
MDVVRKVDEEVGESKMKMDILEKKGNKLKFLITDEDTSFVNGLRRVMINKVPTMAIQEVEFKNNSSILYDEIVAHRLGLIPLKTDLKSYVLPKDCSCKGEGCAKCQVKLTLSAVGPKIVYASEIKSQDPAIVPVFPKIPIVKLLDGQEIEFEAIASLGVGKEHAKHAPAHVYFTNDFELVVNNDDSLLNEFKDKYPEEVFKDGKLNKKLILDNELVDACEGICEDLVKVEYKPNNFVFNIESWGQLEPKDIVLEAVKVFKQNTQDFVKEVENLK